MASLPVRVARRRHCLVDAPFDRVALLVHGDVEGRWATTGAASPQTVADLVGRLGDDSADAASAKVSSSTK
jgi:hypothetical protein